jgi:hypothetical protein
VTDWGKLMGDRTRTVTLKPTTDAVVCGHRRAKNGGLYYYQGLTDEVLGWLKEREIPPPLVSPDANAGWTCTFEDPNAAFEFKMTWV